MKIVAIIPARGGSKGIKNKNIFKIGGFPLIAYTIIAARLSKKIDEILVSTDSKKIAKIAEYFGAKAPFLRPKRISADKSPDIDFVKHAMTWIKEREGAYPDYIVHLRPTTPLRNPKVIDEAIEKIIKNKKATSLRSAHEMKEPPNKMFCIKNNFFTGLFPNDKRKEYHNLPRQSFPPAYEPNGYVDILIPKTILKYNSIHGPKILPLITQNTGEIDGLGDIPFIKYLLKEGKWKIYDYLKKNYGNKNKI